MRKTGLAILLAIFCFQQTEAKIQCYKCYFAKPIIYVNETINLCRDFDYSDKFIVDCPYSTFCMKKIFSAKIPALINGTERDCAYQKVENQNYKNGAWREEISIEEPYEEGCSTANKKGLVSSDIKYCYCKGDLCNSSNALIKPTTILLTVISTILLKL